MREISGLELSALIKELGATFAGARLQKFYELAEGEFRMEFFVPGKGTQDLSVELKQSVCVTNFIKPAPSTPSRFAMQLRKQLDGAIIEGIGQHGLDRVFFIEFSTKEGMRRLIFEMFSNGNVILTGGDPKIISCYRAEEWKDRTLKRGIVYIFPATTKLNPNEISAENLAVLLNEKKLVACLAGKVELAGVYIEEVIARAKLDLNKPASKLNADEVGRLANAFKDVLSNAARPHPVAYYKDGTAFDYALFPLAKYEGIQGVELKPFASISQLLDEFHAPATGAQGEKEIERAAQNKFADEKNKLEYTLHTQREAISRLRKESEEAKLAGDRIYEKYAEVESVLKFVFTKKKTGSSWEEIESGLKEQLPEGAKLVQKIDREKGVIIFEL